jgi:thiamine-monophosphate kinase
MGYTLAELGEFGAIRLFQELLEARASQGIARPIVGIGDDAAVWMPTPRRAAIQTTDLLIEDVHFSLQWCTWYDVGWKAMAVNISDIAAMGGQPRAAFVSAGLRASMGRSAVLELYRGLADCAEEYGVGVWGGDTVASPAAAVINIAMHGESLDESAAVLRRDAARPGDAVAVSGPLGAAAAFLRLRMDELRAAQVHPEPKVALGQALLRSGAKCAMDISDGLLADLGKICSASAVGARLELESVPVAEAVQRLLPDTASALALTGGEDYQLLACGSEETLRAHGMIVVGVITAEPGVRVVGQAGNELSFDRAGYDAFAK